MQIASRAGSRTADTIERCPESSVDIEALCERRESGYERVEIWWWEAVAFAAMMSIE